MTLCCLVLGARKEQGPLVFNYSASSLSLIIAEVVSAFNVMAKIDQWSCHVLETCGVVTSSLCAIVFIPVMFSHLEHLLIRN